MVLDAYALEQTVQTFPPPESQGLLYFGFTERGYILPQVGSRERDRQLRRWDRLETNTLWQGAVSGLMKKIASVPWEIKGKGTVRVWKAQAWQAVDAVTHYTGVLQNAHFGQGWPFFLKRFGRDFHTQDFGAFVEIIGPGEPWKPLEGAATGLAVLDSLRCFATGNPEYPILYYDTYSGKMHRMHCTRIWRFVDMPDGDERLYGSGQCALSRYISVAMEEHLMHRYVHGRLDDKPQPGILAISGQTDKQTEAAFTKFDQQQQSDERPVWGQTVMLHSIDPTQKLVVEAIAFAQTPEKFDYEVYTDQHVNMLALALGVDKQELWELHGAGLGSGSQSKILAQKSRGKAFGDFLTAMERFVNLYLLPDGVDFTFKYKDEEEDKAVTEKDQAYAQVAQILKTMGLQDELIFKVLADRSETFQKVLTDEHGQIVATAVGNVPQPVTPEVVAADDRTIAPPTQPAQLPAPVAKDFSATRAEFVQNLTDLISAGLKDDLSRRRFGIVMRAQLRRLGQQAYEDGLNSAGVLDALDDFDLSQVQSWLADQSNYVSNFADGLYQQGLTYPQVEARAQMWANKSLQLMYDAGRVAADKNGLYVWELGLSEKHCPTCVRLAGQVHRLKQWYVRGLLPKRDKLDCKGYHCDCKLTRTTGTAKGRF
jgi:hypothetical protein